jgi:hypothetical protein
VGIVLHGTQQAPRCQIAWVTATRRVGGYCWPTNQNEYWDQNEQWYVRQRPTWPHGHLPHGAGAVALVQQRYAPGAWLIQWCPSLLSRQHDCAGAAPVPRASRCYAAPRTSLQGKSSRVRGKARSVVARCHSSTLSFTEILYNSIVPRYFHTVATETGVHRRWSRPICGAAYGGLACLQPIDGHRPLLWTEKKLVPNCCQLRAIRWPHHVRDLRADLVVGLPRLAERS